MLTHLQDHPAHPARVVILGSAGFVASAILRRLEVLGAFVLAVPRTELNLTSAEAGARLADILHPDDSLLFVSAKAPVKNEAMLIENIRMGAAVCEGLKKAPVSHVVYISSDAVYADSDSPLTERSCAEPGSLHGVMHLTREVMLANAFSGPLCFLRPTLIYGAGDPHNGYGPNRFMRLAAAGDDIVLFGEGEERRDHVWVEDVAEVVSRVLFRRSEGVLNIAVGEVASFNEIAKQVIHLLPSPTRIKVSPRVAPMPHNGLRAFDVADFRTAFPDFRCVPLAEGLREVAAFFGTRNAQRPVGRAD
jgi:nucleoside-diphosphate-sugar epimerase